MPVTFQVVGNLADFGNDPRADVLVRAHATPSIKVGDVAVHSNEPEAVKTDGTGAFTLELVSLPGVWYRIHTPYSGAIRTVNLAGYIPNVDDPTTGEAFPDGTVIDLVDVVDEDPTPGYEAIALGGLGLPGEPGEQGEPGPQGDPAPTAAPTWATATTRPFDATFGLYNFNARTLSRFRRAKGEAVAGLAQLHVSVLGDSTSHLADYTTPQDTSTWSAHMRDTLSRTLGLTKGGTGIIPVWDEAFADNVSNTPAWEPRVQYKAGAGGRLVHASNGIYGHNAAEIVTDAGGLNEVQFVPGEMVDEVWLYMLGTGSRTQVVLYDGATLLDFEIGAYVGDAFTPSPGRAAVDPQAGYVRTNTPAVAGGLRAAKLTVPRQSNWTAYIRSMSAADITHLVGVEARDTTQAGGLRVSNLAEGGRSLNDLINATNDSNGYGGLPIALDAAQADLAVLALGMNDWQAHGSVATFKAHLRTVVARQRLSGPSGTYGHGTGAAGDVLLWLPAQPDYGNHPPDGVQTPALTDFYRAVYEVADEDDVALIDHAYRWHDYATSAALMRDFIHPNRAGHADQGVAVGSALAAI